MMMKLIALVVGHLIGTAAAFSRNQCLSPTYLFGGYGSARFGRGFVRFSNSVHAIAKSSNSLSENKVTAVEIFKLL